MTRIPLPRLALLLCCLAVLTGCHRPSVPKHYTDSPALPRIYPDYADVTIPVNMAPLCFELLTGQSETVTRFSCDGEQLVYGGSKVRPDVDDWHQLAAKAAGRSICVEVFARSGGQWTRFRPFNIHVSPDSINSWLSYRLISPSYVAYEELTLCQRCLENFDERVMVDNMLCSSEAAGQCVNCHSYQQYNPRRMQFHARQAHGGTVIVCDDEVLKVDTSGDSLISSGVYPSWHPWLKLIAYSTDRTMQSFHTSDINKVEVLDAQSDLITYDIERNEVSYAARDADEMEIFPCWAPDGRSLYYCSAHFKYEGSMPEEEEVTLRAKELKYNIYRKAFDPDTRQFGQRELVFDAAAMGRSATLPRLSPDGRWLMFTLGEWGCFHIWHRDADLWLMDLKTDSVRALSAWNSPQTESYHSWSANGRWVVFSSRRTDGVFTRPYIAHISADGQAGKPYELPTRDPDYHRQLMKSYNVPELMNGPVTYSPQDFAAVLKQTARRAVYAGQASANRQAVPVRPTDGARNTSRDTTRR